MFLKSTMKGEEIKYAMKGCDKRRGGELVRPLFLALPIARHDNTFWPTGSWLVALLV